MEDPARAWPAWKFGMKRDDLFTTLHDQYNTFSYSIQDPDAFHHDVYEISRDADTVDGFHRMMADRRQLRLRELNESLETLAVEIIANPKLMGTEQWNHAVQLFRTKSYDSIVRYFASYVPDDYLDRHDAHSIASSSSFSETDTISTAASCADDVPSPLTDDEFFPAYPVMTTEPCSIECEADPGQRHREPSSRPLSEATQPEPSVSSPPSDAEPNDHSTHPSSRSMSFCGSEPGHSVPGLIRQRFFEQKLDETSQSDCDTAITSLCDYIESPCVIDDAEDAHQKPLVGRAPDLDEDDEDFSTAQYPDDDFAYLDFPHNSSTYDTLDSDTPTPRPEAPAASYMEFRSIVSSRKSNSSTHHQRSPSPKSFLASRGAGSPAPEVRRSPEESLSKIHKSVQDLTKKRRRMV